MSLAEAIDIPAPVRRFKPYPAYKDSGVEWLGEIPAHWDTKHLKWAVTFQRGHDLPTDEREDGRIPVVTSSGISATHSRSRAKAPGIVTGRYGTIGHFHLVTTDYWPLNTTLYSIDLRGNDPSFLRYMLLHLSPLFLLNAVKSAVPGVDRNDIHPTRTVVPPCAEQRAIAAFLDKETAQIDALVAKKEKLTELLQEQRTAAITRAVTKGLDPKVPMRGSGIEWLGEIPAHWEAKRLKYATSKIGSGKTPSGGAEVYVPEGVMLLRSQNVHFSGLRLDDVAFIDAKTDSEMAGSRVKVGDVLLNITGASLGRCCVAHIGDGTANVNQHVCVIRPKGDDFNSVFLAAAFASQSMQDQIFNTENGISRDALNFEQISELWVACPPVDEQQTIAVVIDGSSGKIDGLIETVHRAIDHLKEFRTALIAAAVTGKIDVRGELA